MLVVIGEGLFAIPDLLLIEFILREEVGYAV